MQMASQSWSTLLSSSLRSVARVSTMMARSANFWPFTQPRLKLLQMERTYMSCIVSSGARKNSGGNLATRLLKDCWAMTFWESRSFLVWLWGTVLKLTPRWHFGSARALLRSVLGCVTLGTWPWVTGQMGSLIMASRLRLRIDHHSRLGLDDGLSLASLERQFCICLLSGLLVFAWSLAVLSWAAVP